MDNFSDCKYISVTFDPKLVYGSYQSILWQKYVEPVIQDFSLPAVYMDYSSSWHEVFAVKLNKIIRLYEEKPEFYELDIMMELQAMWKFILANKCPSVTYTSHERVEHDRIKEIMYYLEKNYMDKILLKDISAHIHLCESECSRLFRRYMNTSLFTFLQEYRVERSLEYLADSDYSITEIAEKVGFTDSNYYSKVFSKVKGCSPQKYKKQLLCK